MDIPYQKSPYFESSDGFLRLSLNPHLASNDPDNTLEQLHDWSFEKVTVLRIDLGQGCNVRCIFCFSIGHFKPVKTPLNDFHFIKPLIEKFYSECSPKAAIRLGCNSEITIHKNFTDLLSLLAKCSCKKMLPIELTTNAQTLGRIDFSAIHKVCQQKFSIYASVHTHQKDLYEQIIVGGNYDNMVAGLKLVKKMYPAFPLLLGCNVMLANLPNIEQTLDWAFDEIGGYCVPLRMLSLKHLSDAERKSIEVSREYYLELLEKLRTSGKYRVGNPIGPFLFCNVFKS